MNRLTEHMAEAFQRESREWKEITLEETKNKHDHYDTDTLYWSVKSKNESQPVEKLVIGLDFTGYLFVSLEPEVSAMKVDGDRGGTWVVSSVEFWGQEIDDVDVVMKLTGKYSFSQPHRFSKKKFLELWPHLKGSIDAAHEAALIFREGLYSYAKAHK